jgi:uncharacterized membrane protein YeaQ/YmgE (transglycosylase-associated protein family)
LFLSNVSDDFVSFNQHKLGGEKTHFLEEQIMAKKLKANFKGSVVAFVVCLVVGALIGGFVLENMSEGASIGLVVGVIAAAFVYVK